MSKKDNKELEKSKSHWNICSGNRSWHCDYIAYSAIMQPNVKFSGKPMKWFDDTKLLKKN